LRWDIPGILNNIRSTGVSPWPLPLALQDDCRGPTQMQSKGCATRFVWRKPRINQAHSGYMMSRKIEHIN
jgi:hypothetical protein